MNITSYSVMKLRNGYWSARIRFDATHDLWSAESFHDRAEAESWIDHVERTLADIESFKVSNTPQGTRQEQRTPVETDPQTRKDRST